MSSADRQANARRRWRVRWGRLSLVLSTAALVVGAIVAGVSAVRSPSSGAPVAAAPEAVPSPSAGAPVATAADVAEAMSGPVGPPPGIAADSWGRAALLAPPAISVEAPEVVFGDDALEVTGTVAADAVLLARGGVVSRDDTAFSVRFEHPLPDEPALFAVAPSGRSTTVPLDVAVVPSRVAADEIRAFHVSFWGWADRRLRDPILEMADEGRINAVQLDLKDESGLIGYDTAIPLAHEAGTAGDIFDLRAAVEELHARDVHVIGRIVAFADPVFTEWAWANGARDAVVQTPEGERYVGRYAGFTNPTDPLVREYNIAVAVEAAEAGVDAILWDYIRRPDGPLDNLVFPGFEGDPIGEIASFVAEADAAIGPYQVDHGVSVYGIAATLPTQIAQDIAAMAEHVDYVAPMLYPSHWGPGEYDVADPNRQPYDIIYRSLAGFLDITADKRARVVPWLQDFSLGVSYGEAEVRAQLEGARDAGVREWIMWDPHVRYTRAAYDPAGD